MQSKSWNYVFLGVLALLVILALNRRSDGETSNDVQPQHASTISTPEPIAPLDSKKLDIVSFQCGQNSAYYSAAITVKNLTASEVSFPKVFVQFTPKGGSPFTDSVNISPRHLPANAMGDATLISRDDDGHRYDCVILRIQDSNGARVD